MHPNNKSPPPSERDEAEVQVLVSDEEGESSPRIDPESVPDEAYMNRNRIAAIQRSEARLMDKKPWQMGGEIAAAQRPINSVLEEHFDFEIATKLPPLHTVYILCIYIYNRRNL